MCGKDRLIELMHDFVLFDGGVKKLPRVHQYFGVKAAQEHVRQKKGGIIWHTQGSGKSIVMVLLAKWILENNPNARVAIITDRDELDKQIERVFTEAGEADQAHQQRPRPDEPARPGQAAPALLAGPQVRPQGRGRLRRLHQGAGSPAQPDGGRGVRLRGRVPPHAERQAAPGDEGDDAQRGLHRLHRHAAAEEGQGRRAWKSSAATSTPTSSARRVEDEVVLDLVYEARDIDQRLGSEDKIDAWFEAKTKGLNDWQKDELKKQVGHDAEGAQLPVAHGSRGERHRLRLQRQAAPVRASAATPSWWRPASTRRASISRCSRRRRSRASARS